MTHRTTFPEIGKLRFLTFGSRIQVVKSDVIEMLSRLAPGEPVGIDEARSFLKQLEYETGNGNIGQLQFIASRLFAAFPMLPPSEAYRLLLEHSDQFGQCLPFADVRRAACSQWGALC